MDQFNQNVPHMIVAALISAAAVVLALFGKIDGATAVAMIAGAGGTSLGGALGSSSPITSPTTALTATTSPAAPSPSTPGPATSSPAA